MDVIPTVIAWKSYLLTQTSVWSAYFGIAQLLGWEKKKFQSDWKTVKEQLIPD